MEKFSKEYFKSLADQIMFDLSDAEVEELQAEFSDLEAHMDLLNKIDTEGVEPMVYPFEEATFYLREDEVSSVISTKDALKNAPKVLNDQIVVPKVVK